MNEKIKSVADSISKVIVGKEDTVRKIINALICGGHILIEDVPGVGKTQLVSALARSVDGKFNRIQMTPDIMPSDIIGFSMPNAENEFEYHEGAVMCNFLLADEINRASPKSQSSLLEVMEEFQVTTDGVTRKIPSPFMVLATQNPVETYGTYHLPEAQMDRFFMKISMGYPTPDEELSILDRTETGNPIKNISSPALRLDDVNELKNQANSVHVSENIKRYIIEITNRTRNNELISLGVSPRGSISLYKASRAEAFISGKQFVTPDDVKYCAEAVLAHRIILSPKGRTKYATSENAVSEILKKVAVPAE
jgi:MoxR-like ATPase